jgi:hypothetical protein
MKEKQHGRKKKNFRSSTPTSSSTEQHLNLGDEIQVRGRTVKTWVFEHPKM